MSALKHTAFKSGRGQGKQVWLRRLFSQGNPLTDVELAQMVLWIMCIIWIVPLIFYADLFFTIQNYIEINTHVSRWTLRILLAVLIVGPILIERGIRHYRLRTVCHIAVAIVRAGFFAFDAALIFDSVPYGIAAATHALFALLSLWVVWKLSISLFTREPHVTVTHF